MTGGARPGLRLRRPVQGDPERGASSIELVLYTPVLMLVIFLAVQLALTWHGNEVAGAVAREVARVARTGGGTPDALAAARERGAEYAAAVGGRALTDVSVDVQALPLTREVRATVTGHAVALVPGAAPQVSATVQGPVEEFRPDR